MLKRVTGVFYKTNQPKSVQANAQPADSCSNCTHSHGSVMIMMSSHLRGIFHLDDCSVLLCNSQEIQGHFFFSLSLSLMKAHTFFIMLFLL